MKSPADQHIRNKVIQSRGRNLWIEAGAGTGKTKLLIDRVFSLLVDPISPIPLTRIAAITFTEKAGAELKIKIRKKIEDALAENPDSYRTRLLKQASGDIDIASIGTLHAFAFALLTERPIEAGIDPNARVLDESAEMELMAEYYDNWFDDLVNSDLPSQSFFWYLKQKEYYQRRASRDWLWRLAQCICKNPDILLTAPIELSFDFHRSANDLIQMESELADFAKKNIIEESDLGFKDLMDFHAQFAQLPSSNDRMEFVQETLNLPSLHLSWGKTSNWKSETCNRFKAQRKSLKTALENFLRICNSAQVWDLFELARAFARDFDREKRKRGALGFQDLLIRTCDLLRMNKEIRGYFQRRFDHILIDEFQDTDPLQVEIAFFLCEDSPRADRAEEIKLTPGKLMVVGDPKQSIYRFRRADIEVYEHTKKLFLGQEKPFEISVNFRSVPAIIEMVNRVFDPLLRLDPEVPASPNYISLSAGREEVSQKTGVVFLVPDRNITAEDSPKDMEKAAIAWWIKKAVDDKLLIADKETKESRPLRYGDIAILNKRATQFDEYEDALRAYDVPYRVYAGKVYYTRSEVTAAISGMRAVEDPNDSLSLAQWLTSDLAGFSDEALLLHVLKRPDKKLSYLDLPETSDDEISNMLRKMCALHIARNQLGCLSTIRSLFDLAAAIPAAQTFARGDVAVANLHKILESAFAADRSRLTFGAFVNEWAEAMDEEREESDYIVSEESDDVVRLLTIHKAKGLDWPVVILPELNTKFHAPLEQPCVLFQRIDKRIGIALADSIETECYREIAQREKIFKEAENKRLLYVAMTRARDLLVLPLFDEVRITQKGAYSPKKGFLSYLVNAGVIDDKLDIKNPESVQIEKITLSDLQISEAPRWRLPSLVQKFAVTPELHEQIDKAIQEKEIAAIRPETIGAPFSFSSPSMHDESIALTNPRPEGRLLGSAFHKLLEEIDLDDPSLWPDSIKSVGVRFDLNTKQLELWLERFSDMASFKALHGKRVWREVPFTWASPYGIHYNGVIDILTETDEGVMILDAKTDAVTENSLDEHIRYYRTQGEIYRDAIRSLWPQAKTVRMILCFIDIGKEVEI